MLTRRPTRTTSTARFLSAQAYWRITSLVRSALRRTGARAHHRIGALIDDRLEVRQVHLVQRMVLSHAITSRRSPRVRPAPICPVGNGPSPRHSCARPQGGMAQEVHANRAGTVGTAGARFPSHGEPDSLLGRWVPRRSPHDRHPLRGRTPVHRSAWSVAETIARYSLPRYRTTDDRTRRDQDGQPQHGTCGSVAQGHGAPPSAHSRSRPTRRGMSHWRASRDLLCKTIQKCHGGPVVTG
jgi:hypothetical protein